jgi:hypothetical protein
MEVILQLEPLHLVVEEVEETLVLMEILVVLVVAVL